VTENSLRFDFIGRDMVSHTMTGIGHGMDSLNDHTKRFAKMAGTALLGVGAAMVGLGAAGAVLGVKTAASLEQAQIGFSTLLKSGTKAQTFLKGLVKFANVTPFELKGLIESSRTLIAVGLSTKDTMKALQDFGDTASAIGLDQEHFQLIMLATSKALSEGKFQARTLNEITADGIPIWNILSKAMGVSIPTLRDLSKHGKLLATQVLPILEAQMHKDYGGAMAKQSATLNGLWSTLSDTISNGLATAILPMMPAMKTGLTGAIKIASAALAKMPDVLDHVIGGFQKARTFITQKVVPTFKAAFGSVSKMIPNIDISGMGKGFAAQAITWGKTIVNGVKTGLQKGDWSALGETLGTDLSNALIVSGGLAAKFAALFAGIDWFKMGKGAALASLPFAVGFLSNFGSNLFTVIKEHPFDFALALVSLLGIGKVGGMIAHVLEHVPFLKAFAPLFDVFHNLTEPINNAIGRFFKFFAREFAKGFTDAIPAAEGALGRLIGDLVSVISRAALRVAGAVKDMIGGWIRGMGSATGGALVATARFIARVVSEFAPAGKWIVKAGVAILAGFMFGIGSQIVAVLRTVNNVINKTRAPFGSAVKWLFQAGRQVLSGLFQGMLDGAKSAVRFATSVGGSIIKAVKSVFHISSPSKVFWGIGKNLIHSLFDSMTHAKPTEMMTTLFGGMPQALAALVDKGMISLKNLPSKALGALAGLGGKFAGLLGGLVGGGGGSVRIGGLSAAESWIIMHESGNRTTAQNPTSTAFGLGQLLLANRQHYGQILGVSSATTNYASQLAMFRMYVRDRYGTAENAQKFWKAHHWYDSGGMASGSGWMAKRTIKPERVLSPQQTTSFDRLTRVLDRRGPVGAASGGMDIDYAKLGDHVARAFTRAGVSVTMDGRAVGRVIGQNADLLRRAG
jgi:tape measure domain-containing protein